MWNLAINSYLSAKVKITRLDGTNMRNDDEATLTNNGFNLFRNAEYITNGKCIESTDCVSITTIVKNLLEFSDDYSRSAATDMFWYKDKSNPLIPLTQKMSLKAPLRLLQQVVEPLQ